MDPLCADHFRYDPGRKRGNHPLVCVGRGGGRERDISWRVPSDPPPSVETIVEAHKKNQAICGKPIEKMKEIHYTD